VTADLRDQLQSYLGAAYTLERELGGGGMSRVFVCEETSLKRKVVVKVLPPDLSAGVSTDRFRREIQFAAQLQHPLIVPVLHAAEGGHLLFYTMPLVAGETLRARLKRDGALPIVDALRIMRDVATALAFAHERGIVHRDIKPDNILLTGSGNEGGSEYALVTDFGVARAIDSSTDAASLTSTGVALGTPAYMAPEQIVGDGATDHRADVYAVGVLAYEMLTGQPLFAGLSPQAMLAAHIARVPDPPSRLRPTIPAELDALVLRCLAKDPAERFTTAAELRRDVEALLLRASASAVPVSNAGAGRRVTGATKAAEPRRARWLRVAVLAPAVVVLVSAAAMLAWSRRDTSPAPHAAARDSRSIRSIAVLPFESPDTANEYFSDGVTDELINALTSVGGLRVASRSSSCAVKRTPLGARAAGDRHGVKAVLEGSVRRSGNRLRIITQLTSVRDDSILWSHTYDRELNDVFAVQEELARSILAQLQTSLAGAPLLKTGDSVRSRAFPLLDYGTKNREAYEFYLRGRFFWNRRTGPDFVEAVANFKEAIRRDSSYARAWAGLADSYCIMANFGMMSGKDACPRAEDAARKALALDSTLAEAHASLGFVRLFYYWDPDSAQKELERALALDSTYANAHLWLGHVVWAQRGDTAAAIQHARAAAALEPLSLILNTRVATALVRGRRFDEALKQIQHTLELDSTFFDARQYVGRIHVETGDFARGIREVEALRDSVYLVTAYARAGRRPDAQRVVAALEARARREYVSPLGMANGYAALGDHDAAFRWLEKAYEDREPDMVFLSVDSRASNLHTDPRFAPLVSRIRAVHDRR
jgi:serine/threonine-protein kinase